MIAQRALRHRASVDSHDVYYGAKRDAVFGVKGKPTTFADAVAKRTSKQKLGLLAGKAKPHQVYDNPVPTVRACGRLLGFDLKSRW